MEKEAKRDFILAFLIFAIPSLSLIVLAQEDLDDFEGETLLEGEEEFLVEDRAGITPDSPLYIFDRIVDEVQLATSTGEEKAKKALAIKDERLAEASVMVNSSKAGSAKDALLLAVKASKIAQAEIAPDLENEANANVRQAAILLTSIKEKLPSEGWADIETALNTQLDEEEKTRIALIVSKSRLSYCNALAKQDFSLLETDPQCDVKKAPEWLKGKVKGEFTQREEKARRQIFDTVSVCVVDPKQCDCSKIPVAKHIATCEVSKALAIRCDYEQDMGACDKLDEKEDEFLDILGEEGASSIRQMLRDKEENFFEEIRPPECSHGETFEECFEIMTNLYGTPPFCKGLSDDECMEFIRENPELVEEDGGKMPPECRDEGITNPRECARKMMHKYGAPPECKNIDVEECIDLMMKKGSEHVGGPGQGFPPECEEAGAFEPRECFDIMNEKYGLPSFCSDLSEDECFEEIEKKHGPEGGPQYPPECEEAGVTEPRACHNLMNELYGPPRFCEGLSDDECFEETMKRGPEQPGDCPECGPGPGGPDHEYDYNPPECETAGLTGPGTGFEGQKACSRLIMELYGMPAEFCPDMTLDECVEVMSTGEPKGGEKTLELCVGISPDECKEIMRKEHGGGLPPECEELSQKECSELMHKQGGVPGGVPLECTGLSPKECDRVMMKKYGPPECKRLSKEECETIMQERGAKGGFGPKECEGLPRDECDKRMMKKYAPLECEGLSVKECKKLMMEREPQRGPSGEFPTPDQFPGREEFPARGEFPEQGDFQGRTPSIFTPECEGMTIEECKQIKGDSFVEERIETQPQYPPPELVSPPPPESERQKVEIPEGFPKEFGYLGIPEQPQKEPAHKEEIAHVPQPQPEPQPAPEPVAEKQNSNQAGAIEKITGDIVGFADWLKGKG